MTLAELLKHALPPACIALIAVGVAPIVFGWTLPAFMLIVVMVCLLATTLSAAHCSAFAAFIAVAAAIDTVAAVLLAAVFASDALTFYQWLQLYLLLLALAGALGVVTRLLMRLRLDSHLASTIGTTLAVLWLTSPIWLSLSLRGAPAAAGVLTDTQPILAMNGLLRHLGYWFESGGIMYHLTTLNQDVPVSLPRSLWIAIAAHAAVGVLGAGVLKLLSRRQKDGAEAPGSSEPTQSSYRPAAPV